LLQGDLETAANWQRSFHGNFSLSSFLVWLEVPEVTRCRVLIAIGSEDGLNQAFQELETMVKLADEIHNTFHRVDLLVLQALALCKLSRMDESLKVLEQALSMAEPGGWIRPFVEPGPQMADLLSRLKNEKEETVFVDKILAAFKADEEGLAPEASDSQAAPPSATKAQPLVEPLTFRELETLELLTQGLYNKEIADKLSISLEIVKTHLKNIYQKLGVSSRQQAVHRARTLEILPRH
jgi:LuxR family maltose regulon positive regulatory protein